MRFGMGEVFQFSSPYKWRCSKRFYRLFVYCSWLLIARDNSTGFTIQWGRLNQNQTFYGFPRGFSSFMSVSFSQSGASSYNVARLALNGWPNNSGFNLEQANDGKQFPAFYIACGFS